jgi:signal peptidase
MRHKANIAAQIAGIVLAALIVVGCLLHFIFGFGIYVVRSGSMTPFFRVGDTIITAPANSNTLSNLKPGDVISFEVDKALTTHRILSIDGGLVVTKGDANEDPDAQPVNMSQIRGVYLLKIPFLGYLTYFIRTRLGWFLLIILPALILVGLIVKDILKEAFKPDAAQKKELAKKSLAEVTPDKKPVS